MDQVSILHSFESDSALLVNVPLFILCRPLARSNRYHSGGDNDGHDEFMKALSLPVDSSESSTHDSGEESELSVMRMTTIRGSRYFHKFFLQQCELYCRLCCRLQRAVEWILQKRPKHYGRSALSTPGASSVFDIDSLFHVVYPLEPTAFVAAAFALPLLVSVSSAISAEDETTSQGGRYEALSSSQPPGSVPYCFFYNFPEKRFLCDSNGSSGSNSRSSVSFCTGMSRMTLLERVTAIFNAVGICGSVPPVHNTMSIRNRTKIGLTLSAYLEGCLPRRVNPSGGGMSFSANADDLFSRWKDDVLWRLLGSLVSALAVVHASGFHFRGELSAEDVLCFALPGGSGDDVSDMAQFQQQEGTLSVGKRLAGWVEMNQQRWLITEATPAHRTFFMFATLPRSIFVEEPQDPSFVAAAQRRDTAAVGRILVTVLEESKRRRMMAGTNSCQELLFVAERMAAVGEGDGGMMASEAPAQRFAQLQAVQLRTHIWLLRSIVEERDTQLAAAASDSNKNRNGRNGLETSCHQSTLSPLRDKAYMAKFQERERLLAEREKKLDRFLELYEMTAERLDQLPAGKDGFDRLKESLTQAPLSRTATVQASSTAKAATTTATSTSPVLWTSATKSPPLKPARHPTLTDATMLDRAGSSQSLPRFSQGDASGFATGLTLSSSSRPMTGLPKQEKRPSDGTPRSLAPRVTPESASRRGFPSSGSPSLLHPNGKTVNNVLCGVGISPASAAYRNISVRRRKSVSPGAINSGLAAQREVSLSVTAAEISLSPGRGKALTRPPSAKQTSYSTLTVVRSQQVTPSQGRQSLPRVAPEASGMTSPGVSPLIHSSDNNSSQFMLSGYKTPTRTTLMVTSPLSSRTQKISARNKVPALQSSSLPKDSLPGKMRASMTSRAVKESGGSLTSTMNQNLASSPSPGAKMRVKSPHYDLSRYAKESKDVTTPKPATATTSDGTRPSPSRLCSTPRKEKIGKNNDSVQVIRMCHDSNVLSPFNCSSERCARLQQGGDGVGSGTKTGLPSRFSPTSTRLPANVDKTHQSQLHTRHSGTNGTKQDGKFQPCVVKSHGQKQEQEEITTPRTSRLRLANDGWVNHHLEALEQLRYDFQNSELAKSARDTPRAKAIFRNSKERSPARMGGSKVAVDDNVVEKTPRWSGGAAHVGVAAQMTINNSAECM